MDLEQNKLPETQDTQQGTPSAQNSGQLPATENRPQSGDAAPANGSPYPDRPPHDGGDHPNQNNGAGSPYNGQNSNGYGGSPYNGQNNGYGGSPYNGQNNGYGSGPYNGQNNGYGGSPYNNQNNHYGSNYNSQNNGYGGNYPYYNRSAYQLPKAEPGSSLANAAMVMGILSIICCFTFTVYPAFILGSIAITLALLSKGTRPKLFSKAKTGIICAVAGLAINTVLVTSCMILFFTNPNIHAEVNRTFKKTYGVTFDDFMEDIMEDNRFSY